MSPFIKVMDYADGNKGYPVYVDVSEIAVVEQVQQWCWVHLRNVNHKRKSAGSSMALNRRLILKQSAEEFLEEVARALSGEVIR